MQNFLHYLLSKTNNRNIFGAVFFTSGVTLIFLKSWIVETITTSLLTLKPNSAITDNWLKISDTPTDLYIFNWTNPEEFLNPDIKPKFEQVGPYRYMQILEKTNVVWNDNDTVTYNNKRTWHFTEKGTNGSIYDKVTTFNIINMLVAHYIRDWNYFIKKAFSAYMYATTSGLQSITRTVDQLLSQGFEDYIVVLYNYLPFIASDIPRFDKFGFLFMRNASDEFEGIFNMATGINGNFEILNWNYQNTSSSYDGSCAKVRGSNGELYSRKLKRDGIGIFAPDLCRFVPLDFEEEVYVGGILGYKFVGGKRLLDNGTLIPENKCGCAGECIPSGMLNISSCRYGLPAFLSFPHFYGADPVYLDSVEGLHPEKSKHEAYLILEPETSIVLEASLTVQFNLFVHSVEDIGMYEDIRKLYFPVLFAHQKATLPKPLMIMLHIFLALPYIIIGVSVIFICTGVGLQFYDVFKSKWVHIHKRVSDSDIDNPIFRGKESYLEVDTSDEEMQLFTERNIYT